MSNLILSALSHTWILDLDGTILKHNGYKIDGKDTFLPGAKAFLEKIPQKDLIVILTSRKEQYRKQTEDFLKSNGVRYDHILFEIPYGERILINDKKPSGLITAIAINPNRDEALEVSVIEDVKK